MITQELYTKMFLKEWGKSVDLANVRLYKHTWWFNTRTKKEGGLRLTVFSEKKSFELYMFSDDIRKYGLIKAMNKQKKSEET